MSLVLTDFLTDPQTAFKWWAITGPGGSGKSRLAYEFKKRLPNGWKSRYLGSDDYDDLSALPDKLTEKTLLIADYVQEYAKELGKFIARLNKAPRDLPLRVLLVEREANDESETASWVTQLYSDVHDEIGLKKACYKEFLNLQPLSDDNLKEIIRNYAIAVQSESNRKFTDKKAEMLLQRLKKIDPDLCRPLYAMFLTDAYISENDPEQWNREKILDYVVGREIKRLDFNIAQATGSKDEKLLSACKYLWCTATVLQDMSMEVLKELCPEQWDIIEKKAERFESPEELLTKIGLAVKDEIPALRPDLMGEYYVLNWLMNQKQDTVNDFLNAVWSQSLLTVIFFARILDDYKQLINEKPENWDLFILDYMDLSEDNALFYSIFLVQVTARCNIIDRLEKCASTLEKLSYNYTDIIIQYAKGLVNLINKQDVHKAEETISKLQILKSEFPENTEIAVRYAKGLFNLSCDQDEHKAEESINKLEVLHLEYPENTEITIEYAKGLVNLISKQDEYKAEETISKLEILKSEYPENTEIVVIYVNGLFNLSNKQNKHKAKETISRLEVLKSEHPENTEIVVIYAKGLFNLSCDQDEHKAEEIISRLEVLKSEYPENTEIAVRYAKGLFNLSCDQDKHKAKETISRLEVLKSEFPENTEIVVSYANGLFNLSCDQDEHKAKETISRLEVLKSEYPENTEIAVIYAKGLVILICEQDEHKVEVAIKKLKNLYLKHPDVKEITAFYVIGLKFLSLNQHEKKAAETEKEIMKIRSMHPEIESILSEIFDID